MNQNMPPSPAPSTSDGLAASGLSSDFQALLEHNTTTSHPRATTMDRVQMPASRYGTPVQGSFDAAAMHEHGDGSDRYSSELLRVSEDAQSSPSSQQGHASLIFSHENSPYPLPPDEMSGMVSVS
jgi:hypothetical protein